MAQEAGCPPLGVGWGSDLTVGGWSPAGWDSALSAWSLLWTLSLPPAPPPAPSLSVSPSC